jgi:cation:H+ antiporter
MSPFVAITFVAIGGALLYFGAEWLVRGSAGLARAFGVKPLVVGLTLVAYGTSAPELAVSLAAIVDEGDAIVLGNVIGSCIANLGLILGLTALIKPPEVDGRIIRREVPILLVSVGAVFVVLANGVIGRIDALFLVAAAAAFTIYTLSASSKEVLPTAEAILAEAPETHADSRAKLAALTVLGLGLLLAGGYVFVEGSRDLALWLGISERVVGLTVVALGTSVPELAASLVAAVRGHAALAIGNVVGSNIFNIFLVLGGVGLAAPIHGSLGTLRLDLIFLVAITLFGALAMRGSRRISRVEGALFVAAYVTFITLAIAGW